MSNQLKRYYLQQMGIQTWVERYSGKEKALAHLAQEASHSLFTRGNPNAKLMIIANGQVDPFVGKAATLLSRMLRSTGFDEQDVFVAASDCKEHLDRQVALVSPRILLTLSEDSAQQGHDVYYQNNLPCINSFHPEYLLKYPRDKKTAFLDLLKIRALIA